jgi:hypothetical protein
VTYGVVAIVKDAAETIVPMLTSAYEAGATVATIVDTGSTDDTIAKIEATPGDMVVHLWERPWVNFGRNRSEAFALALGSADWLFALDADMTVAVEDFEPDPTVDAYNVEMGGPAFSWRLPLVLNGQRSWRSYGAVHEYTALASGELGVRVATDAVRVTHPGANATPEKIRWHVAMLEEDLGRDPANPRTVYYLAQAYRELGQRDRARALYLQRAQMGSWEEERWHAQYQAALLTEPWPSKLEALLGAWQARPARREPLWHAVAGLRAHGQELAADALAAIQTPECTDILFVERGLWP